MDTTKEIRKKNKSLFLLLVIIAAFIIAITFTDSVEASYVDTVVQEVISLRMRTETFNEYERLTKD